MLNEQKMLNVELFPHGDERDKGDEIQEMRQLEDADSRYKIPMQNRNSSFCKFKRAQAHGCFYFLPAFQMDCGNHCRRRSRAIVDARAY